MSFATDGSAIALASASVAETAVKAALGALVGTYGLVKQYELNAQAIALSERGVVVAETYLGVAQNAYNTITLPTFNTELALFNGLKGQVQGYLPEYLTNAFSKFEYTPDYVTQEGRALGIVQAQFDRAALQKARQVGQYASGRRSFDATWFATMAALARIDAVNHAYRFEEARQRYYDDFYWKRQSAGAKITSEMLQLAVNALNRANANVASGLTSMGHAEHAFEGAIQSEGGAIANQSNMWGKVSNGAFAVTGAELSGRTSGARANSSTAASNPQDESSQGYGFGYVQVTN